jgi:hypothetical protein
VWYTKQIAFTGFTGELAPKIIQVMEIENCAQVGIPFDTIAFVSIDYVYYMLHSSL